MFGRWPLWPGAPWCGVDLLCGVFCALDRRRSTQPGTGLRQAPVGSVGFARRPTGPASRRPARRVGDGEQGERVLLRVGGPGWYGPGRPGLLGRSISRHRSSAPTSRQTGPANPPGVAASGVVVATVTPPRRSPSCRRCGEAVVEVGLPGRAWAGGTGRGSRVRRCGAAGCRGRAWRPGGPGARCRCRTPARTRPAAPAHGRPRWQCVRSRRRGRRGGRVARRRPRSGPVPTSGPAGRAGGCGCGRAGR